MAVSKRIRFEVLRRDGHACRYCGGKAPDVRLTVDHVMPVALGGSDDPTNLVAACADCNSGKASVAPDAEVVADVAEDALRWTLAMEAAQEQLLAKMREDHAVVGTFLDVWEKHGGFNLPSDFAERVIGYYRAGLPEEVIKDAAFIATGARHVTYRARFGYFCGICRNRLKDLRETAASIASEVEV
jgi:hypothetical protein